MTNKSKDNDASRIELLEAYKMALQMWDAGHTTLKNGTPIRTFINHNTRAVRKLVWRAGCGKRMTIGPPPAIGGLVMRGVDPFDSVFESPYGRSLTPIISDMTDECVGVIRAGDPPPETPVSPAGKGPPPKTKSHRSVFIVHGRDNETKQTVARFLEKLGLEAVILHERGNAGLTVIEKFEKHSDVAYAVVLMTPDDVGALKAEGPAIHDRARQNVVFELGYFIGKLGRKNVCAVLRGDIERPSDSDGIIYVAYDPNDGWKLLLTKELKEAGLDVDLNTAMQS